MVRLIHKAAEMNDPADAIYILLGKDGCAWLADMVERGLNVTGAEEIE